MIINRVEMLTSAHLLEDGKTWRYDENNKIFTTKEMMTGFFDHNQKQYSYYVRTTKSLYVLNNVNKTGLWRHDDFDSIGLQNYKSFIVQLKISNSIITDYNWKWIEEISQNRVGWCT